MFKVADVNKIKIQYAYAAYGSIIQMHFNAHIFIQLQKQNKYNFSESDALIWY